METIKQISIELIDPHPENPRKNLGNLTELAESIKANGIMQNLTVVPKDDGRYMAVIGHRRLAAAKLAGLETVPCAVVDMDRKTQLSTMLLENMQRSELSYIEQADGFQLMLDLGETVESISEMSGFSKDTVKHRLEIAKLDRSNILDSDLTLEDFAYLEKISDVSVRNTLIKNNKHGYIKYAVDRELQDIEKQKKKQQWIDYLENKGVRPIPEEECRDARKIYNSIKNFNYSAVRPEELELPEETPLNETFYKFEAWGDWIYFYKKKPKTEVNDEAEASRKRAEEFRIAKIAELDEEFDYFNERVMAFVNDLSEDKKTLPIVLRLFVEIQMSGSCYSSVEDTEFCEAAGVDWKEADMTDEDIIAGKLNPEILYNIDRKPAVFLLKAILCMKSIKTYKSYSGEYDENVFSLCAVKALKNLGFKLTNEEQQLIDGTHEIYGRTCENE